MIPKKSLLMILFRWILSITGALLSPLQTNFISLLHSLEHGTVISITVNFSVTNLRCSVQSTMRPLRFSSERRTAKAHRQPSTYRPTCGSSRFPPSTFHGSDQWWWWKVNSWDFVCFSHALNRMKVSVHAEIKVLCRYFKVAEYINQMIVELPFKIIYLETLFMCLFFCLFALIDAPTRIIVTFVKSK